MRMNRRNALLGLGAITTGGGGLFASGAFSNVEANRDFSVGVSDDTSANLALSANNTTVATDSGGAGNELSIDATAFNPDATTVYKDAFDITHSTGSAQEIAISSPTFSAGTINVVAYVDQNDGLSSDVDLSSDYLTLSSGADLTVGIEAVIDPTTATSESGTFTIEAAQDPADLTITTSDSNEDETT